MCEIGLAFIVLLTFMFQGDAFSAIENHVVEVWKAGRTTAGRLQPPPAGLATLGSSSRRNGSVCRPALRAKRWRVSL